MQFSRNIVNGLKSNN